MEKTIKKKNSKTRKGAGAYKAPELFEEGALIQKISGESQQSTGDTQFAGPS